MITVANPIYDIVFKYLMEDERIARTLLSALLKKNVVKIKMKPHEYTNIAREGLSVFRIDFGATIQEDDGCRKHGWKQKRYVSGNIWVPSMLILTICCLTTTTRMEYL